MTKDGNPIRVQDTLTEYTELITRKKNKEALIPLLLTKQVALPLSRIKLAALGDKLWINYEDKIFECFLVKMWLILQIFGGSFQI